MLDLEEIKKQFPIYVQHKNEFMLKEYLQCLVLKFISTSPVANKLIFIGGTALRIFYNTQRFSEDLDFDNKNLTLEEWIELGDTIKREISLLGINIDIAKTRMNDTVFHHNLRFPELLFKYEISPHKNSVLLIKMDSEDQGIKYEPEIAELNKFNIRSKVKVMPVDIALSQKFRAFFDRKMGRDLFDISSIAPQTKPNYAYLKQALAINNAKELKEKVLARCDEFDFEELVLRAKTFIFKEDGLAHILHFKDYMKQYEF